MGKDRGAYVNAIALAHDDFDFCSQIKLALKALDLEMVSLEDVETMVTRLSKYSIDEELRRIAAEVKRTGSPAFDTFHTFPEEGTSI